MFALEGFLFVPQAVLGFDWFFSVPHTVLALEGFLLFIIIIIIIIIIIAIIVGSHVGSSC